MKNDNVSLIFALQEVKTNSWIREVAKTYNISEQEVRDLYESNLQTAYDYLNLLSEEGKRLGGILDPALNWLFGKKKIKDTPEAPSAAPSSAEIPTDPQIIARAKEKTVTDIGDIFGVPGTSRASKAEKLRAQRANKPNDDVNPPASRPATDVEPGSMRDRFAKGPEPQPAADLKAGDMRSSFLKGPATDSGVAKADAAFKNTSQAIGARKAAETSSSAIDMPKNNLGNISRNKTMDSNVNKVAAGLAGAGVLGGTAALIAKSRDTTPSTQAEPSAAAPAAPVSSAPETPSLKPATVIPDKPKFEFGSKKGGIVSAAELGKYREYTGNKNVTLGQYMNARDDLTAKIGGKNDPQQIMKSKNLGAADVYRPDQIKAGKAQRARPAGVTESLIDAFMKLQDDASGNIFEAAKKAKKDYDKDGKVESPKDEVWGSRFRAAKAAGKMQEESEAEKAKKKSMSHELDAPSSGGKAPETTTDPDWLKKKKESKVVQTGKNTSTAYKAEEVEFSDAELAHFASIVEGNPMAPVPDDYSGAANGVSKRDLSDETVAENKKMNRIDLIKARLKSKK